MPSDTTPPAPQGWFTRRNTVDAFRTDAQLTEGGAKAKRNKKKKGAAKQKGNGADGSQSQNSHGENLQKPELADPAVRPFLSRPLGLVG